MEKEHHKTFDEFVNTRNEAALDIGFVNQALDRPLVSELKMGDSTHETHEPLLLADRRPTIETLTRLFTADGIRSSIVAVVPLAPSIPGADLAAPEAKAQ